MFGRSSIGIECRIKKPAFYVSLCLMMLVSISSVRAQHHAPLGHDEKIRLGWTQWHHWNDDTVPKAGTDLLDGLANVGVNLFADWKPSEKMGRHARKLGMRYYSVGATANLRGVGKEHGVRLAVDRYGMTCPEQFEKFKAEGGDITAGWNRYGEHHPADIPCPLEPLPWQQTFFDGALKGAQEGWLDGVAFDAEAYGAYWFDQYGDMLCYCDHCFALYQAEQNLAEDIPRQQRFGWLEERRQVEDYLTLLRSHQIDMIRQLVEPIRQVYPGFGFALYPDFGMKDVRDDWRLQGLAFGMHTTEAPFLVIDATPYWEDHTRPFWEQRHHAYRQAGFQHVLGSWDAMMNLYPYMDVGAEQANYEFAMHSDGFWRWGERVFHPNDWRMFASVNQRLRQMEARLGDYLLRGEYVDHFVTVAEETGSPWLERAIVANTFRHGDRYLIKLDNGNQDWPIELRVRIPRVEGSATWRLVDPIYNMTWAQADGTQTWTTEDLDRGLTVAMRGRSELFLLLEPVPDDAADLDRGCVIRSFEVTVHLPRPVATEPLPEPSGALTDQHVLFTRTYNGPYPGTTSGGGHLTNLSLLDTSDGKVNVLFAFPGYVREPMISADRTRVAVAGWNNGRSQIYVIQAIGGQARNISNNGFRDRTPVFSPDGTRIAFVSDRDGDWDIYTMSLDGTDVRQLTDMPGTERSPAWSPNGQSIAFIANRDGDFDVFATAADGSGTRRLVARDGNEYEPLWSPDGTYIACTVQRRWNRCIQVVRADGTDPYYIGLGSMTQLWSIRWSPDGRYLAGAFSHHSNAGVVIIDREEKVIVGREDWNGERLTKLVNLDPVKTLGGDWYHTGAGTPRHVVRLFSGVSFAPDGNRLVFCSNQTGSFQLYTISTDRGSPEPLANTETAWPAEVQWAGNARP